MGQPPHNRIPDEKRAEIAADMAAGMSRGAAAKKHGVSQSTASKIAAENAIESAQPPELTVATKTFLANVKERRAQLKEELLEDIAKLRKRAWSEYTRTVAGKEGPYTITEELPPLGEVRNAYAAIGVAISGYTKLEQLDAGAGTDDEAKSLMSNLLDGFKAANAEMEQREADGTFGNDLPPDEVATINVVRGEVVHGDG